MARETDYFFDTVVNQSIRDIISHGGYFSENRGFIQGKSYTDQSEQSLFNSSMPDDGGNYDERRLKKPIYLAYRLKAAYRRRS